MIKIGLMLGLTATMLCGCAVTGAAQGGAPVPLPVTVQTAVTGAAAAETAAAVHCPRGSIETAALLGGRVAFDLNIRPFASPAQLGVIDAARAATDRACFTSAGA